MRRRGCGKLGSAWSASLTRKRNQEHGHHLTEVGRVHKAPNSVHGASKSSCVCVKNNTKTSACGETESGCHQIQLISGRGDHSWWSEALRTEEVGTRLQSHRSPRGRRPEVPRPKTLSRIYYSWLRLPSELTRRRRPLLNTQEQAPAHSR